MEDGREFLDEEGYDGEASCKGRKSEKRKRAASKNSNIRASDSKSSNIRSMFAADAVKPKKLTEQSASLNEDDLLNDIMAELKQPTSSSFVMPPPVKLKKTPIQRNPFGVERKLTPFRDITAKSPSNSSVAAAMSLKPESNSKRRKLPSKPERFGDYSDASQEIDQFASQEKHEADYPSQKTPDFDKPIFVAVGDLHVSKEEEAEVDSGEEEVAIEVVVVEVSEEEGAVAEVVEEGSVEAEKEEEEEEEGEDLVGVVRDSASVNSGSRRCI